MAIELDASPPKVERREDRIMISFSVGDYPVFLNFSEGQAERIGKELLEAVSAGE